jgi:hypothetical protein
MTRRIGIAAVLAAAGLALAGAANALAATTIGSNLAGSPNSGIACPLGCTASDNTAVPTLAQAAGGLLAPSDGVVVRWRIKVGAGTGPVALRITRPGNSDTRTGAGTGPVENPPANTTTTYDVRLPIQAGDAVGLDCCLGSTTTNFFTNFGSGLTMDRWSPPLQDGAAPTAASSNSFGLLVNADIEADADHDGFGDETQDKCIGTSGPFNGCPNTVTVDSAKQKGTKPEVKVTATVPGAGTLAAGSPSDRALANAAASTFRSVRQGVTATSKQRVTLTLKLTKSAKRKLAEKGKLKTQVKVVYTPTGGPAGAATRKIKLKS